MRLTRISRDAFRLHRRPMQGIKPEAAAALQTSLTAAQHTALFTFSSRPFPERMARLAICGSASGRASKMISTTPMGLDT